MTVSRIGLLVAAASAGLGSCCLQAAQEASGPDGGLVDAGASDAGAPDAKPPDLARCFVVTPPSVDFGNVLVGSRATQTLRLINNCGSALPITIGRLSGTDPLLFATVPPTGQVITLADKDTTSVTVQYDPLVASSTQSQAALEIKGCPGSTDCERTVQLSATAVSSCLTVLPSLLDFSQVASGDEVDEFVTLTNSCSQTALQLTGDALVLTTDASGGQSTEYAFQPRTEPGAAFPLNGSIISAGRSLVFWVAFFPPRAGEFYGELDISTNDAVASNLTIPLRGVAEGAVISCAPPALDFGLSGVGISSTLSIVCTNVGTDIPNHPEASLFIPEPYSGAQALTIAYQSTVFAPSFEASFPTGGLKAGESVVFDVAYSPTLPTTYSDDLVISSNGALNGTTRIPLTGSAVDLARCRFLIDPSNLVVDFGHVTPGTSAIAHFDIENVGADDCVVNAFQVRPGSSQAYSLLDLASSNSQTIPGNGQATINVHFAPTSAGSFDGRLTFTISNPDDPHSVITLGGTSP